MTETAIDCRLCNHRMDLVAIIQPFGNQPGLNAYACTTCGHTDSQLIAPYSQVGLAGLQPHRSAKALRGSS
jgi:hypothetical protein